MTKTLVHFVQFIYPGLFVSETSDVKIESRDKKIKIPDGAFGYRLYDKEHVPEGDLWGPEINQSGWTFVGTVLSLAQVKKHPKLKRESVLISNMEINKIDTICYTRRGNCVPVGKKDTVISRA